MEFYIEDATMKYKLMQLDFQRKQAELLNRHKQIVTEIASQKFKSANMNLELEIGYVYRLWLNSVDSLDITITDSELGVGDIIRINVPDGRKGSLSPDVYVGSKFPIQAYVEGGAKVAAISRSVREYTASKGHYIKEVEKIVEKVVNVPVNRYVEKEVVKRIEVPVEKIVEVEVQVEVPVLVEYYDSTFLDKLYRWYCKQRGRLNQSEFV